MRYQTENTIENIKQLISSTTPTTSLGHVVEVRGPVVIAQMGWVSIGDIVRINRLQKPPLKAQVVGFRGKHVFLSPFNTTVGLCPGAQVRGNGERPHLVLSQNLLGQVVNHLGVSVEQDTDMFQLSALRHPLYGDSSDDLPTHQISQPISTGVRSIDCLTPLGKGQRMAVFAEPGVGKSMLMSMIAKRTQAQVNVIGLIGERGREVVDFVNNTLDSDTIRRTVVVASTSDEAAVCRVNAAHTATSIAEYFRDQGCDVLLQIDSLTRLFRAYRELGLAAGEVPVRRGYPPSVFSEMPRLIERAGVNSTGSITALYTVLRSSDLDEDPMVEEIKGLTDGHIELKRAYAENGIYPALDPVSSLSRLAGRLLSPELQRARAIVVKAFSRLSNEKDLVALGSVPDYEMEKVLNLEPELFAFLSQTFEESISKEESQKQLISLASQLEM